MTPAQKSAHRKMLATLPVRTVECLDGTPSRRGCTKVSDENIRRMNILYATGEVTQRELAAMFGVSHATISNYLVRPQSEEQIVGEIADCAQRCRGGA